MEKAHDSVPSVLLTDENKGFGGAERHVLTLGRELVRLDLLRALVARQSSWLAGNLGDLPFYAVGFRNEVDMLSVFSIYRKLKSSGANVLHCIGHRDLVASALARQLPGAPPTVLVKAEHSYPDANLSPLFRWAYAQCDAITSVSQALRAAVQAAVSPAPKVKTPVIHNGIDTKREPAPAPPTEGRALHIGVLSALREGKGHEDFLLALSRVKSQYKGDLRFSVAGDGELKESLQGRAAALGIEIEFPGHQENPTEYLESLDLSVVPSHKETFSLVTLETLACGRPLVAADSDGVAELCRGFPVHIYPVGDSDALAGAILDFCAQPAERHSRALEAVPEVRARYNSKQMAEQYRSLYSDLLAVHAG